MLFFCQTIFHQGKDNSFFNFTSRGQGCGKKRYNAFHLSTKLGYCWYYNYYHYYTNYELLGLILAQTMFLLLYGKLRHFFPHTLFFSSLPLPKVLCPMAATIATSLTQFYDIEGKKPELPQQN